MTQIDVLLNGLVSRYNSWWDEFDEKGPRKPPIWILAGDFNCTPNSPEIRRVVQSQFINLNPRPEWGSRGDDRELNVDYIFAGPKYRSLKHRTVERYNEENPPPINSVIKNGVETKLDMSDHFPVYAQLRL
jgi:endonuclease/exonuclease/phosphatase family metal-dependent hydrolase